MTLEAKKLARIFYATGFLFTLHYAILEYIHSSFLEQFLPISKVGLIYIIASLLGILVVSNLGYLLSRFGSFLVTLGCIALSTISVYVLAKVNTPVIAILFFVVHYAMIIITRTNFDIYLESASDEEHMGRIRGSYLSSVNFGWLMAPLIIALVVKDSAYAPIYLLSSLLGVIVIVFLYRSLNGIKVIRPEYRPFWHTAKAMLHSPDLARILSLRFLFNFFISWMVIYIPPYLHETIGFSWETIGTMFFIMLLPYVLFELPLGKLADTRFGEKEFLAAGFGIMSLAAAGMSLLNAPIVVLWIPILFLSRVGASFVESMSETYFFKKVSTVDTNAVEFFRDTDPLAYIIAPLIGSLLVGTVGVPGLLLVLAGLMIGGVAIATRINDTR